MSVRETPRRRTQSPHNSAFAKKFRLHWIGHEPGGDQLFECRALVPLGRSLCAVGFEQGIQSGHGCLSHCASRHSGVSAKGTLISSEMLRYAARRWSILVVSAGFCRRKTLGAAPKSRHARFDRFRPARISKDVLGKRTVIPRMALRSTVRSGGDYSPRSGPARNQSGLGRHPSGRPLIANGNARSAWEW